MTVKAAFILDSYVGYDGTSGKADLKVSGQSADGTVDFRTNGSGALQIYNIDLNSTSINSDIEAAVKAKLQLPPYSMTFVTGDTVRLITK